MLTLYLALGCPDRIRFEYSFVTIEENMLTAPPDGIWTKASKDPEGEGISNGLRRLLHLNASEYLLLRDWQVCVLVLVFHACTSPYSTSVFGGYCFVCYLTIGEKYICPFIFRLPFRSSLFSTIPYLPCDVCYV